MERIIMRTVFAAIALAAIGSVNAMAADMPVRRAAPAQMMAPTPVSTWSGCYVGGNIGGAFGDASLSGPSGTVSTNGSGFTGGGQIGCDYQFSQNWVLGFRNMFNGTSNNRS